MVILYKTKSIQAVGDLHVEINIGVTISLLFSVIFSKLIYPHLGFYNFFNNIKNRTC